MHTFKIIALLAATATPALASVDVQTTLPGNDWAALDIADRAEGFRIGELDRDERGGLPQPGARDIGDRESNFLISELSKGERDGNPVLRARDIADRAARNSV